MTTQKKNTGSKKAFLLGFSLSLASTASFASQELTESVEQLVQNVESACPTVWEDLGTKIVSDGLTSALWDSTDTADRDSYITFHLGKASTPSTLTTAQQNQALSDIDIVVADCTAARTALLSKFYSNLPQDVVAAMAGLDYEPGEVVDGFEIGDIRHTGRLQAADGWIFLHGVQTVGSSGSGATFAGSDYRALFELALLWAPNRGTAINWDAGQKAVLPNLNGKVIAGGGSTTIGNEFGLRNRVISLQQLPRHTHNTVLAGHHNHTMGNDTHSHAMRTSTYLGSATPRAGWDYFGDGRPRANYQFTHKSGKTILNDTHKHTLTGAGGHEHSMSNAGNSQPLDMAQPSMQFRVEMKYK